MMIVPVDQPAQHATSLLHPEAPLLDMFTTASPGYTDLFHLPWRPPSIRVNPPSMTPIDANTHVETALINGASCVNEAVCHPPAAKGCTGRSKETDRSQPIIASGAMSIGKDSDRPC
jgi:hypothetical protein